MVSSAETDAPVTRASTELGARVRSLALPPEVRLKRRQASPAWILCLLLLSVAGWLLYQWRRAERRLDGAVAVAAGSSVSVQASAEPVDEPQSAGTIALESKGYIIAAHQILVSPEVSGRILRLNIEEGQRVTQGQILAEIETTQYDADLQRAEASHELARQRLLELQNGNRPEEIKQAEAELAEADAQLSQLASQHERNEQLRDALNISAQEFEVSQSLYRAMLRRVERLTHALALARQGPREERIAAAAAEVEQFAAEVEKAAWRLKNCQIRAPISGTILRKNAEEGNIVNPVAFNGSFSLCEMADLSDLEVELDIQERDISRVFVSQRCQVRAEAYPDRPYAGEVSRLMPIADRSKGAVPVRVKLTVPAAEEGVYLKPEMGAIVAFMNRQDGVAAPPAASAGGAALAVSPQTD